MPCRRRQTDTGLQGKAAHPRDPRHCVPVSDLVMLCGSFGILTVWGRAAYTSPCPRELCQITNTSCLSKKHAHAAERWLVCCPRHKSRSQKWELFTSLCLCVCLRACLCVSVYAYVRLSACHSARRLCSSTLQLRCRGLWHPLQQMVKCRSAMAKLKYIPYYFHSINEASVW